MPISGGVIVWVKIGEEEETYGPLISCQLPHEEKFNTLHSSEGNTSVKEPWKTEDIPLDKMLWVELTYLLGQGHLGLPFIWSTLINVQDQTKIAVL